MLIDFLANALPEFLIFTIETPSDCCFAGNVPVTKMTQIRAAPAHQTRDSVKDIWGPRQPYKGNWSSRVDSALDEEPEKWVQSACVLCRYCYCPCVDP